MISQGAIGVYAVDYSNGWHLNNGKWSYFDNGTLRTSWFKDKMENGIILIVME